MTALAFAIVVWWSSNTVAHLFVHRPFFRRRSSNRLFALAMSLALGIPQTLWRDRHLAHHAGVAPRLRWSSELTLQVTVVLVLWAMLIERAPMFFATVYVPGYLGGLLLCVLHGHFEHAGGTVSYYGRLYNVLLFNDGYHVEHHANPGVPWSRLPERRDPRARASAWPAPLRWVERGASGVLEALERVVLGSPLLQRFVLRVHERALRELIAGLPRLRHIVIVGGGLFPRTALILQSLVPHARITIVDSNRANLDRARARLTDVTFIHARYPVSDWGRTGVTHVSDPDLVIVPLCFDGDREAIYGRPPAPAVIVHDWIWHKRGISRVVSIALLKRVNLLTGAAGV